jgi:hypothetical protein
VTAREASFCKALFFGVVAEDLVFPFPGVDDSFLTSVHERVARVRKFVEAEVDSVAHRPRGARRAGDAHPHARAGAVRAVGSH